jgi:hypothetical protein
VTLRKDSLKHLSIEWYGEVKDCDSSDVRLSVEQIERLLGGGGFGEPVQLLSLRERVKHSNFGECTKCSRDKELWAQYRATSARGTLGDAEEKKREIFSHVLVAKE